MNWFIKYPTFEVYQCIDYRFAKSPLFLFHRVSILGFEHFRLQVLLDRDIDLWSDCWVIQLLFQVLRLNPNDKFWSEYLRSQVVKTNGISIIKTLLIFQTLRFRSNFHLTFLQVHILTSQAIAIFILNFKSRSLTSQQYPQVKMSIWDLSLYWSLFPSI